MNGSYTWVEFGPADELDHLDRLMNGENLPVGPTPGKVARVADLTAQLCEVYRRTGQPQELRVKIGQTPPDWIVNTMTNTFEVVPFFNDRPGLKIRGQYHKIGDETELLCSYEVDGSKVEFHTTVKGRIEGNEALRLWYTSASCSIGGPDIWKRVA